MSFSLILAACLAVLTAALLFFWARTKARSLTSCGEDEVAPSAPRVQEFFIDRHGHFPDQSRYP